MPIMLWDQSLDLGVSAMNAEHRDILDAMNAVYDSAGAGESGPAMMVRIARLADITQRHFEHEEAFMERTGYPGIAVHKSIHRKLLSDFATHAAKASADGGRPSKEFFSFLRLWLSAHIKCIDRKYADHAHH